MDERQRKIYVNSPVFTREDEERFRYISTEVDDAELTRRTDEDELRTLITDALGPPVSSPVHSGLNRRPQEEQSTHLYDSLDASEVRNYRAFNNNIDPSRFEDVNFIATDYDNQPRQPVHGFQKGQPFSVPQKGHPPSESLQQHSRIASKQKHVMQTGVHDNRFDAQPYTGQDEVEEFAEARLERQRHHRQARQAHIPHLDLIASEDEAADGQSALDLEVTEGRPAYVDNTSYNPANQQYRQDRDENRTNLKTSQQNGVHNEPRQQRTNEGYPAARTVDNRQPMIHVENDSYVQDSLEVPRSYQQLGNNEGNPEYARVLRENNVPRAREYGIQRQSEGPSRAPVNTINTESRNTANGDDKAFQQSLDSNGHAPIYRPPVVPRQNDHSKNQLNSVSRSEVHISSGQSRPTFHSPGSVPPQIYSNRSDYFEQDHTVSPDFVESNRQGVKKKPKTYGQIHSRKKEQVVSENSEPRARRRWKSDTHPRSNTRVKDETASDSSQWAGEDDRVSSEQSNISAEQLWQERSRVLAAKKESANAGDGSAGLKNRRHNSVPPLRKYGSDTQMEVGHQSVVSSTGASSAPYQRSQDQYAAFSAPPMVVHPNSPQKVSVDINLNVISPRASLGHPSLQFHGGGPPSNNPGGTRQQNINGAPPQASHMNPNQFSSYHLVPGTGFINSPVVYSNGMPVGDNGHYIVSQQPQLAAPVIMSPQHNDIYVPANGNPRVAFNNQQQTYLPVRYSYGVSQPVIVSPVHYQYQAAGQHPYVGAQGELQSPTRLVAPQHATPTGPYKVLPPVASSPKNDQPEPATELWTPKTLAAGGGSYAEQYRRLKKRSDYKMYTVDDYRKLKKEMKLNLGSLGPDLDSDTLRERKEKVQRQQEYARAIQERNKLELLSRPSKLKTSQEALDENDEQLNRRRAALEYAKSVPKPKVVPRSIDTDSTSKGLSTAADSMSPSELDAEIEHMLRMRERHKLESREQQAIRLYNGQ